MPIKLPKTPNQEIRELLEQNLELNEEIHKMVKSIKLYVVGQRIWFFIKLIIIIIPIALGAIFLPSILKPLFEQYQQLLGLGESAQQLNNIDLNSISPSILNMLK